MLVNISNLVLGSGAPEAERGPGASSNVTELWFCKFQNRRRKRCFTVWSEKWCDLKKKEKKGLLQNLNVFCGRNQVITNWNKTVYMRLRWAFHFSMSFGWAPSRAHGPPKLHGSRGHCPPLPPSRGPWLGRWSNAVFYPWKTLKVLKLQGLCPGPRWGSSQRSPIPPGWI